ncbi:MAG: universal stress protein [Aquificaceae bacterium]
MRFLVPVDFTEITNPLLRVVKTFAQAHQAEVGLLNVVAPVLYLPYPESFGMSTIDLKLFAELQERQKERAKEKLLGLVEFLKPVKAEPLVEVGDSAEIILEKEKDYHLTFMGSHKRGLIERIFIGSTTEKVVKYSHKPIFILKGKEPETIRRVLIAYDFSEHAKKAIDFAIKLLKPFSPHLLIIHVEETIEIPLVEGIKDSITEKYKEEKLKHLKGLEDILKGEGFQTEFHIIEDRSPAEGIKGFLKENPHIDLIVLGSRGLSGLKRVLLGSTSSELVRSLDIPILVHRGEE